LTGPAGPGGASASRAPAPGSIDWQPDLPVAQPPFDGLQANWKQRMNQPYVFVELEGSYTRIGTALQEAEKAMRDQGLEASGPPFALYYDDPGLVPAEELIARACFPVRAPVSPASPLRYDLLESTTVVYAFVAGPYPDVPRAYPAMFRYMRTLNWAESGPIREVYLVNPAEVADFSQLVTEVQIPAANPAANRG
jgi:effector-binding domain-containing protein